MSTNIEHSSCTESQLPLSEIMLHTLRDFQDFKKALEQDPSERAVQKMMATLSEYKIDKHLPGSISIFFMATVDGLQTPTYKQLLSEISSLVEKLEEKIPIQKQKEMEIQKKKEEEIIQAQQRMEDTQTQQNSEGTQAQQDAEATQPQQPNAEDPQTQHPNTEDTQPQHPNAENIQAQQHKENVKFVKAMLKVLYMHSDEITSWFEDSVK